MRIIREVVPESTLAAFCEAHGLAVKVNERARGLREAGLCRYWCSIPGAETKNTRADGVLRGSAGNGETEQEALAALAAEISERLLVLNAFGPERREIQVPRLLPAPAEGGSDDR